MTIGTPSNQRMTGIAATMFARNCMRLLGAILIEPKSSMQPAEKPNDQDDRNRNADQP
jgi:hypothetical protein